MNLYAIQAYRPQEPRGRLPRLLGYVEAETAAAAVSRFKLLVRLPDTKRLEGAAVEVDDSRAEMDQLAANVWAYHRATLAQKWRGWFGEPFC